MQFNITKDDLAPLLSYNTCLDLGLITINDSDDTPHLPAPEAALSVCATTAATCTDLLDDFKDVFEGLGNLPGEYHIVTEDTVPSVVHLPPPPPAVCQIKSKLDEMVANDIIAPVSEPAEWVFSMLVVVTPKKLRICLDPRDLNRAIRREHYQMPNVEEVVTRLTQAKKFTVVDAKDGFWQKRLNIESSIKTTFNTPLGRYKMEEDALRYLLRT